MIKQLYTHRYEIFLVTQLLILFGSLLFPEAIFENLAMPIFFLLNIGAGILLVSKNRRSLWLTSGMLLASFIFFGQAMIVEFNTEENRLYRLLVYFLFYIIVTWNVTNQVWRAKTVDKTVVVGLMSGYISLGFLAFFLFMSIELLSPGSFVGVLLEEGTDFRFQADSLMYYAYITLLTIGYGEIIPSTPVAQKAAILVGLVGQFYVAIITAVVVEKYIRYAAENK